MVTRSGWCSSRVAHRNTDVPFSSVVEHCQSWKWSNRSCACSSWSLTAPSWNERFSTIAMRKSWPITPMNCPSSNSSISSNASRLWWRTNNRFSIWLPMAFSFPLRRMFDSIPRTFSVAAISSICQVNYSTRVFSTTSFSNGKRVLPVWSRMTSKWKTRLHLVGSTTHRTIMKWSMFMININLSKTRHCCQGSIRRRK